MDLPGLFSDSVYFPERKSIVKTPTHHENIVEQVKKIDVEKVNFDGEDFQPHMKVIQKQKVYIWIRLYIKEEIELEAQTKINMIYNDGQETLETTFICFGKKGLERDVDGQIVNFNPEDDKRVLCLMIDSDRLNINNEDIPYMKTLFTLSKFFKPQYIKKYEFKFFINGESEIDFYDIDF
jgi:hypothetical protein